MASAIEGGCEKHIWGNEKSMEKNCKAVVFALAVAL